MIRLPAYFKFLAALSLASLAPLAVANAATLVFVRSAEIRSERVLLKDIAKIEGAGILTDRLLEADLGRAPALGRSTVLTASSVVRWVQGQFPGGNELYWRGSSEVVVKRPSREVSSSQILEAAAKALETFGGASAWTPAQQGRNSSMAIVDLPFVLVSSVAQTTRECERVAIQVEARSGTRSLGSTVVWFKQNFVPGAQKIVSEGCEAHQPQLTAQRGSSLPLPVGVEKMDSVFVEVVTPVMSLETSGIALGNAKIGQPVRIQRDGSTGTFMARVVSNGRVRVENGGLR